MVQQHNEDTAITIENRKIAIPLPAPSSTYSNGNAAYGGNQSFVHSSNEMIRGSTIQNDYWSTESDGAGSSTSVNPHRLPGVVGLTNIGNTCFMNSGLQCLLSTPSISEFFLKSKLPTGPYQKSLALLQNFQYIVKQAWCGPQPKLALHDFKNCLALIHSQFKDSRQHDCQEFLTLLLDSLHEQLTKWHSSIHETSDDPDSGLIEDGSGNDQKLSIGTSTDSLPKLNENCCVDENEPTNSTQTVTKLSEVRTPFRHSGLKDHNVRRSNFEAKSNHQIKRGVRGAQISYFDLPNFTPAGSLSNKSNSSTSPKSSTIKENQWMAIKSQYNTTRRRKKKNEELDAPGCSKKTKLDTCERQQQPEQTTTTCQNTIQQGENHAADLNEIGTEKDQLPETINGIVKSEHACNGDISSDTKVFKEESLEKCQEEEIKKQQKPLRLTDAEEAERALSFWEKHISANNTVIVKTFQGLFKSKVICSTCDYVSVTYQPLMYLSLPFPGILERHLAIWFIRMKDRRPRRIEVQVDIMDSVVQLKQKLIQSIPEDFVEGTISSDNLVMAEVCNYSVCRLIENSTVVSQLNYNRNMYMYELNENFNERYETLWTPTAEFNSCVVDNSMNNNTQLLFSWNIETTHPDSSTMNTDDMLLASNTCEENWDLMPLPEKPTQDQQQPIHSPINNPAEIEKQSTSRSKQSPESDVVSSSVADEQPDTINGSQDVKTNLEQSHTIQCIICLEDCAVTDMRQHVGCSCIICVNCLENSIKHHHPSDDDNVSDSTNKLKCATCMNIVDGKDFIQYRSLPSENGATKLTMELVYIIFRNDPNPDANNNSSPIPKVFGYPWLIKIPSTVPAQEFHDYIASINPFPQVDSKILTVNADGKSCGTCSYGSSCHGCEFPRTGNVIIRPRTSIAISYVDLNPDLLSSIEPTDMTIEEPFATSWYRSNEPNYDIHDCLRAFFEKENLDDQNPWFCPNCNKHQCATKSLRVCHFPDYLIVYLKRFIYLDYSSNKLNNKMKFPVNDLDLNEYISKEFAGKKDWKYDLYGCICHFGSMSSGHYTAYGKNPVSGDWHYFNDDSVSAQCPQDVEHSSGYILFYARKGVEYDIPYKQNARPLPELVEYNNSLSRNRPVNSVPPNASMPEEEEESWDTEDQVSSSTSQSKPVSCSFSGGSTMNEMTFSVGVCKDQ